MKWAEKELVLGTTPPIRIGRRLFRSTDGSMKATETFWATYSLDGKQHYQSLEVLTREDAHRAAIKLAQKIEEGTIRPSTAKIKLGQIVEAYLTLLEGQGRAPKTLEKYRYVLTSFQTWWEKRGNKPAQNLTVYDVYKFKDTYNGLEPKTICDRMIIVRQLLKWAAEKAKPERLLPRNPLADEPMKKVPSRQQPCFTPEQVRLLLANADPILKPVFAVMAYAGLRFGEVRDLMWDHIQLRDGGGTIRVYGGGQGRRGPKNGKYRTVPVNAELAAILREVPHTQDRVFSHPPTPMYPHGSRPLDERRLVDLLKALCKQCGFADWKKYKLHTFRHTFASMCARTSMPQKYVLDWMGHSESGILNLYITLHDETAQSAINQISFSTAPKAEAPTRA